MKNFLLLLILTVSVRAHAQNAPALFGQLRAKMAAVKDYQATGDMHTAIPFLKVPDARVTVYFRAPDRLRIRNEKGISLVPKGTSSISLANLLSAQYQVIDGGKDRIGGVPVVVIRLLPLSDTGEIVLATLYVDPARMLVLRSKTTTRSSGTSQLDLQYGRYAGYGLPDRVAFTFNMQEYKLPKGMSFDYDDGAAKAPISADKTGRIEIVYSGYRVNGGIPDRVFQ